MTKIIIIGRGGHALSCLDVIRSSKNFEVIGFVDTHGSANENWNGLPYLGTDEELPALLKKCSSIFLGIGQIQNSSLRRKLVTTLKKLGANFPVIASPHAYISPDSNIAEGSIIMHGAHIGPGVDIGAFNIINTKALIEHESSTGEFVHISTAAVVNGNVSVGSDSFIGSNSVLCHGIKVPANSFVQAGQFIGRKHDW